MNLTASSPKGTRRLQFFAGLWLWLEALFAWLGPFTFFFLIYLVGVFWGLFDPLPPLVWLAVQLFVFLGLLLLLVWQWPHVAWPNRQRIQNRLERAGKLSHQPLQTLGDVPMRRDALADSLWQHHRLAAARELFALRWPDLRAGYVRGDPFALRYLLIVFLLLAVVRAPDLVPVRWHQAIMPFQPTTQAALAPSDWQIYIVPPTHTGLQPFYLTAGNDLPEQILIPNNSQITASVMGGILTPRIKTAGTSQKFIRLENNFYQWSGTLTGGDRLRIRQGLRHLVNIAMTVQPDTPPTLSDIKFTPQSRGRLRVDGCVKDRYGLQSLTLQWQAPENNKQQAKRIIPLDGTQQCGPWWLDVGAAALAGQTVLLRMSIENAGGQTVQMDTQNIILPRYDFKNDTAKTLSVWRQDFMLGKLQRTEFRDNLLGFRRSELPVEVYLTLQSLDDMLRNPEWDDMALANLWQAILRLEEGEYADIADQWRGVQSDFLSFLSDWRVSEKDLILQLARMENVWTAYAPAMGYDPMLFDFLWRSTQEQLLGGNRAAVRRGIKWLAQSPGDLLEHKKEIIETKNKNHAEAIAMMRTELQNPDLSNRGRDFFEAMLKDWLAN